MTESNLVWYACYGSNLDRNRFLCYIEGGNPKGSAKKEVGCKDKTHPLVEKEMIIPHPLYFAKNAGRWNNGGVAFIGHKESEKEFTLGRMYLITAEQFKDVVRQENDDFSLSVNLTDVIKKKSMTFRKSWYGHIISLGEVENYPIFTFTAYWDKADVQYQVPSNEYLATILRGLLNTHKLTNQELIDYIIDKPGIKDNYTSDQILSLLNK
ncbi:hypothetical protein [Litchfieldia alkalitelluris]|uniref:hypothetical protein n=1 Tax=Litchfieldia alkalitelluris TaxID=304268 RepID=UPI00099712E6|nr:hypothetical protein [Litchfieldia alkalitelluris]